MKTTSLSRSSVPSPQSAAAIVRHRVSQSRISHHWLATAALIAALTGTITITDGAPAPDPVPGFHIAETIIVAGDAVTPPTISGILKGGPPNGVAAVEISSDLGFTDPWKPIHCVELNSNGEATFTNLAATADRSGSRSLFFRFRVADIMLDHYDDDGGFHPTDNIGAAMTMSFGALGTASIRSAFFFVVPPGDPRRFVSLKAPIHMQSIMGPNLRISLRTSAGLTPGPVIEVLSLNQLLPVYDNPFTTSTRFCSRTFPVLNAGAIYWIVCEPVVGAGTDQLADYRWYYNQTPGRTVFYKQQFSSGSALPTGPWPTDLIPENLALKIETLPIP